MSYYFVTVTSFLPSASQVAQERQQWEVRSNEQVKGGGGLWVHG